jgi:hypothetical protein
MKIIGLGDTHGRTIWKEIVGKESDADKIVFIGDYFDTHENVSPQQQIDNFKEIIEYKKQNKDKVILLIGNHDFHYIKGIGETYSGYQAAKAIDIGELLHLALSEDLMQMCYVHLDYVFTHAGVTKTWASRNDIDVDTNLEESINELFKFKPRSFCFTMGDNFSQTGNDISQTPIWVRPQALVHDMIDNVRCVVGHTTVNELSIMEKERLILIDSLWKGEYLSIIDGATHKNTI